MMSWSQLIIILYVYFCRPQPHLSPQDVLVDVGGEDGGGGQQGRVGGGHDGGCHRPDAHDGDVGGREVLQDDGQDETRLPSFEGRRRPVGGEVPVCGTSRHTQRN